MSWALYHGEARAVLATWPAASVQCVVTSPPYWGLRDYGTATWAGGDSDCSHQRMATGGNERQGANKGNAGELGTPFRDDCGICGARRIDQQLGLESSPDAYVAALVDVFREVRRVLAVDGVCWLNLGDSYNGGGGAGTETAFNKPDVETGGRNRQARNHGTRQMIGRKTCADGLKPKDLIGIPWRVAFALQADGWYLRSDVIWSKPNPMPESVTDRPTKAHEYVFLLTKSERYAYDADAIREPISENWQHGGGPPMPELGPHRLTEGARGHQSQRVYDEAKGANARSVWTMATEASPYEHFAVMPKALARRCILAGCAFGKTVLDPFAGVATTGVVALEEGRSFVGVELNPKYHALGRERLANVAPLFATEAEMVSA